MSATAPWTLLMLHKGGTPQNESPTRADRLVQSSTITRPRASLHADTKADTGSAPADKPRAIPQLPVFHFD